MNGRARIDGRSLGFTLIELMAVMAIMVILMAISVPMYLNAASMVRGRSGVEMLRTAINKAKYVAVSERRAVRLVFPETAPGSLRCDVLEAYRIPTADEVNALDAEPVTGPYHDFLSKRVLRNRLPQSCYIDLTYPNSTMLPGWIGGQPRDDLYDASWDTDGLRLNARDLVFVSDGSVNDGFLECRRIAVVDENRDPVETLAIQVIKVTGAVINRF